MMRKMKKIRILFCLLFSFFIFGFLASAEIFSIEKVLNNPSSFDQKLIVVEGEAIGEVLKDEEQGFWINISSQDHNVGVFSQNPDSFKDIVYWGQYEEKGDTVRVRGIFYETCPQHQIADIHLKELEVVKRGYKQTIDPSARKVALAKILFIICLILGLFYLIKAKYARPT